MHFTRFLFNDTAPSEIYTLSLHDALPISLPKGVVGYNLYLSAKAEGPWEKINTTPITGGRTLVPYLEPGAEYYFYLTSVDRKSTRLNSSHSSISYAVFCLKKKNKIRRQHV